VSNFLINEGKRNFKIIFIPNLIHFLVFKRVAELSESFCEESSDVKERILKAFLSRSLVYV